MKRILLLLVLGPGLSAHAQELYVYSESASGMAAHSLTPRLTTLLGREGSRTTQRYLPELMAGFSRGLMVHSGLAFSNMPDGRLRWEAVYLYGKYRLLSNDDVHRHFRVAAFTDAAYSRRPAQTDEINLRGERSGVQLGLIATQLTGRTAFSVTIAQSQALDRSRFRDEVHSYPYQSLDYGLSGGLLVLPVAYRDYRQLNVNIYLELLGQRALDKKSFYTDLAPAVQVLFNSNSKLSGGYRFQLNGNERRNMQRGFLLSFEHSFFNALGQ